ncbi:MAG: hypothetical protein ACOY3K_08375 [Candidatus Omnitrophota bacterium]
MKIKLFFLHLGKVLFLAAWTIGLAGLVFWARTESPAGFRASSGWARGL